MLKERQYRENCRESVCVIEREKGWGGGVVLRYSRPYDERHRDMGDF